MRKDFAEDVSSLVKIKRTDLVEKDIILHELLIDLSKDSFSSNNLVFKGGTCLIKHYLGYFRFSEDLDFTWKDQELFEGKSQKEIRKILSEKIDKVGSIFEKISAKRRLDFKAEKGNRKYFEFGGGNKTVTLKLWYISEVLKHESFIKVTINFVEKLIYNTKKVKLKSLLSGKESKELSVAFPERYKEYSSHVDFQIYDLREIMCEKVRALLTRQGIKARDFVDVYLVEKEMGRDVGSVRKEIIEKIDFMLEMYTKYRENLKAKERLLESEELFEWGAERELLLEEIDEKKFYKFNSRFMDFLKGLIKDIDV